MDERKIITNTEEENRAVNPQDKSPEEAPTAKEASIEETPERKDAPDTSSTRDIKK